MSATRTFASHTLLIALLAVAGAWLWLEHARAWDLGRASPVLGYDAAQYAVAARELAEHGRLATPFALPVELARHATPPWPLALVQPGLVLVESALFRIAGTSSPERSSWLVLVLPFVCYLAAGIGLAVVCSRLVTDHAPEVTALERFMAAFVVGLAFLLDPEAQHFAIGGFTELPFTLGLAASVALLALDARTRPIAFGVGLGVAGLFRGNILWLAPILAAAYGASAPERRVRAFTRAPVGASTRARAVVDLQGARIRQSRLGPLGAVAVGRRGRQDVVQPQPSAGAAERAARNGCGPGTRPQDARQSAVDGAPALDRTAHAVGSDRSRSRP